MSAYGSLKHSDVEEYQVDISPTEVIPVSYGYSKLTKLVVFIAATAAVTGAVVTYTKSPITPGVAGLSSVSSHHRASDREATEETTGLLTALWRLQETGQFLTGHKYTNVYGQNFQDLEGKAGMSDFYESANAWPGVFGYDFTDILENGMNFTEHIKLAYRKGGVPVFQWYPKNPYSDGDATDMTGTPCKKLLEGGTEKSYERYIEYLDVIAKNIASYKHDDEFIPLIFRLMEDSNSETYWWGTGSNSHGDATCSDGEYKMIWNMTRNYLNNHHGLHNIIWEYMPSSPGTDVDSAFVERYPGNELVDIVGFSHYSKDEASFSEDILSDCQAVANFSVHNGLIAAASDIGLIKGLKDVSDSLWYYTQYGEGLMEDSLCHKISYAMTGANMSPKTYNVPLKDQTTYNGFKKLVKSGIALFADSPNWKDLKMNMTMS